MTTIGVLLVCRDCRGPLLFSTNPKRRPDRVYNADVPIQISMLLDGTVARCERCGQESTASLAWSLNPPILETVNTRRFLIKEKVKAWKR